MKKMQNGMSILGLLISLAIVTALVYFYMKPQNSSSAKPQAPKNQIELNQLKNKLNQQVEQKEKNQSKSLENL